MPVERKDVETMIKAELSKITSRLDALGKKVDAHQTTFSQRDEERKKKLEAIAQQISAAGGKPGGVTPEAIEQAAGPRITEIKTGLAESLEQMAKDKASAAAMAEANEKAVEEAKKQAADIQACVARIQVESRLAVLESMVKQAMAER